MVLGEVIGTIRRSHGLTQAALADRAGVTQAALSRYEQDLRTPDPDTIATLAVELGVTVRLLEGAGAERGAMAIDAHMRRKATAKATDWRLLEARLNVIRYRARQLFEEIALRATDVLPTFDPFDTTPADAARMVRMQWRMPSGPVRRLTAWLEATGAVVVRESFPTPRVDGLSQWIGDHPVVLLNTDAPTDRLRWTAAHELGHLCLHSNGVGEDVEDEANRFAAEFLMPESVITDEFDERPTMGQLVDLKRRWGVSMQALVERAATLKVIDARRRSALFKQLSAHGWRTREPAGDELTPEETRLTRAIADALHERGMSDDEIARLAGYADATANDVFVGSHVRRLRTV